MRNVMKRRRVLSRGPDPFFGISGGIARYDTRILTGYADDDPVGQYLDAGSGGLHGTASGDDRAIYASNAGGSGKPGLTFSGAAFYTLPDALKLTASQAYTFYFVASRSLNGAVALASWTTRGAGGRAYEMTGQSLQRQSMVVGGAVNGANNGFPINTRVILRFANDTVNFRGHVNGVLNLTGTSAATTIDMSGVIASIGSRNGEDIFFQGYIQDVVVFGGYHDSDTAAIVENALTDAWGL